MTVCQDLADHVPEWTGFYAITGLGIDMIRPWLSLGLITLHAILTADIATRRQKSFLDPTRLNYFQPLISDGLLGASDPSANTLATMDPTEDRRVIHPAFTAPDDPGPETAWRWAHQREKPWREEDGGDGFVLAPRQTPLRACGYVFWDARRLQAWGMLRGAWEGPDPDALEAAREEGEEAGKAWLEARAEELAARGVIARGLGLR